ncbi:olfactory receptor, partial [Pelobates cultripes]
APTRRAVGPHPPLRGTPPPRRGGGQRKGTCPYSRSFSLLDASGSRMKRHLREFNISILKPVLFIFFLLIHLLTLTGNLIIIILVAKVPSLKSPMYFFLSQLSLSDVLLTTNIAPSVLCVIINRKSTISFAGCITQLCFYGISQGEECLLLTVMSYDRYLAICNPLQYTSIMDHRVQIYLVVSTWFLAFLAVLSIVYNVCNLHFCGPNIIDHYFCDLAPLLQLTCSDSTTFELISYVVTVILAVFPLFFILYTYISIFITIFGISSNVGKQKAFSTCSSHLIVVCMYYGTLIVVYMAPSKGHSFNVNKVISLLYTMGTPLLNPIIYSLRNQEIKRAAIKKAAPTPARMRGEEGPHLLHWGRHNQLTILLISTGFIEKQLEARVWFLNGTLTGLDKGCPHPCALAPPPLRELSLHGALHGMRGEEGPHLLHWGARASTTKMYFNGVSASAECLVLTVMSYDRYWAICKPLHFGQRGVLMVLVDFHENLNFWKASKPTLQEHIFVKGDDMRERFLISLQILMVSNISILKPVLFIFFLLIHLLTLTGNLIIIILVAKVPSLKSPMYFFLSQLSLSDVLLTTNIAPSVLCVIINRKSTISFAGCITQLCFYGISQGEECLLLTVMSYDRYLAICNPLQYTSIMDHRVQIYLVVSTWFLAFLAVLSIVYNVCNLHFCGPNIIDHYFCDLAPLLQLTCSDSTIFELISYVVTVILAVFPLFFILYSYISIFITIFGISSNVGKQKAFSTCSSHLIVVCMYYGTLIVVYMAPSKGHSFNVNKVISLLYTMGTPLLNPIIYSLRNQEIKRAARDDMVANHVQTDRSGTVLKEDLLYDFRILQMVWIDGRKRTGGHGKIVIETNWTEATQFLFLKFQWHSIFDPFLFLIFLFIYFLTLTGNLIIILLVAKVQSLKSPMYFFLSQLSLSDILLTTNITPNMLHIIINGGSTISIAGCITQMYFHGVSATSAECLLLTVMLFDRYLAICKPLRYTSIMNLRLQIYLVISSWFLAFIFSLVLTSVTCQLRFCGPYIINHFFCDFAPILEMSCSDVTTAKLTNFVLAFLVAILPFSFIIYTYIYIFITIFRIPSTRGKQKAFSTCSSHLIVVSMYYGTIITVYIIPNSGSSFNTDKAISLLYTMGTPLLNPIIYSLRNRSAVPVINPSRCCNNGCEGSRDIPFDMLSRGGSKYLSLEVIMIIHLYNGALGKYQAISLLTRVQSLKSPMYFFLSQLSLSDILLTTNITPNILHIIINGGSTISIAGCITQMYIHGVSASAECLLLTVMSYDRYLAICKPLHYTSIMNLRLQIYLVISSWFLAFLFLLVLTSVICHLRFCGPHIINHFFCDFAPILEMSCSDVTIAKLTNVVLAFLVAVLPFSFIVYSYIYIFITIFRIPSTRGKQKAFSTCSSHLIVVSIFHLTVVGTYYGTLISVYMAPSKKQSFNVKKVIALLYTIVTPFFNPIIYSMEMEERKGMDVRLKEMEESVQVERPGYRYLLEVNKLKFESCSLRRVRGPKEKKITYLSLEVIMIIYNGTHRVRGALGKYTNQVQSLKSPMYFFLSQLSLSDILLTTNITPNILHIISNGGSTISIAGCITQMYIHGVSASAECLLLTVMSYDRYLAICKPLHYTSIMNLRLQIYLVISSWFLAFLFLLVLTSVICHLRFCGPHIINHFFCDFAPILEMSCSDVTIAKLTNVVLAFLVSVLPFSFIVYTYIYIFITIFRIPSTRGKQKAFSTCSSHLIVVSMYYGTIITVYIIPNSGSSFNTDKAISLLYTMGTPLLNPIIYSLRNHDIKTRMLDNSNSDTAKIKLFRFFHIEIQLFTVHSTLVIVSIPLKRKLTKMKSLKSPMYFFISHLSMSDILLTTNIVPNMLNIIIKGRSSISITGCITQLYFYGVSTAAECLLLTVMSYDRYLAICRPLHYMSIMDRGEGKRQVLCLKLNSEWTSHGVVQNLSKRQSIWYINPVLFAVFLVIYILTLIGNLAIIILVARILSLKSPMYFFLSQLSLSDILLTTNIVPNMLNIIINRGSTITFTGCIIQLYFYGVSATSECFLLSVMSYDRYLAICDPLHYMSIMDPRLQLCLVIPAWTFSFLYMLIYAFTFPNLQFCGHHIIDHYFCDFPPLLELCCSDITTVERISIFSTFVIVIIPFSFIIYTYISIFKTIFRIPSIVGKQKAFSTCSSHLIVVSTYYGTLMTIYMAPSKFQSFNVNKIISLLYTLGTPFFNPIIYCLRNQEIKRAMKLWLCGLSAAGTWRVFERCDQSGYQPSQLLESPAASALSRFTSIPIINPVLFAVFLIIYILTLIGNLLIILLVAKVPSLKSPMYFFLSQLSFSDILLTTNITPNLLNIIINEGSTISIAGCITQFYLHSVSAVSECLLLTVMSYDRYLAICDPLHYSSVMDLQFQLHLVVSTWSFAFSYILIYVVVFINIQFCGPNIIDHYFCDFALLIELCCSGINIFEFISYLSASFLVIFPFALILYSYISIFITIFRIPSMSGKQKAFSTCSSHLIVVSTYYGTLIVVYMAPSKGSLVNINKVISLLYTMGTPIFNPIIYSLRNQEIKRLLQNIGANNTYFGDVSIVLMGEKPACLRKKFEKMGAKMFKGHETVLVRTSAQFSTAVREANSHPPLRDDGLPLNSSQTRSIVWKKSLPFCCKIGSASNWYIFSGVCHRCCAERDLMEMNRTKVTEFFFLKFQSITIINPVLFAVFLIIYILTLIGNLLIILLVAKIPSLKSPMYFFLSQLSLSDILLTTNITPNLLNIILNEGSTISIAGCITQFYFHCVSAVSECLLLTVMSYDRYLAICDPLHYSSVMDPQFQLYLVVSTWSFAFSYILIYVVIFINLQFCGPNIIDHYFCDFAPLLELCCSAITVVEFISYVSNLVLIIIPFFFILFSYISIFITIFRIPSMSGKQKAFSTCSSHLIVVSTYYGTLISVYMAPSKGHSFNINKVISLLYTMATPVFNPITYSLRNQEIKRCRESATWNWRTELETAPSAKESSLCVNFMFLAFQNIQEVNYLLFVVFLIVYILTLISNLAIIILVTKLQSLHSPMYFFLSQLSLSDILLTTDITPNVLRLLINGGSTISTTGCITQFYFFSVSAIAESLLLTLMSYDRFLAICDPLHYASLMVPRLQLGLVISIWSFAFLYVLSYVFIFLSLRFCGPRIIDHYFCDFSPLLELCCSNSTVFEFVSIISTFVLVIVPFSSILYSYISIFITIYRIPSVIGKQKAFSTCSSHLIVVCMHYGTLMAIYMAPTKGQLFNVNKFISLLYTAGTPFFNPVIYSLRNEEIKRAMFKCMAKQGPPVCVQIPKEEELFDLSLPIFSHLIVYSRLCHMYVCVYVRISFNVNKFMSLLFTMAAPFFNPIIYSLRNKEIKNGQHDPLSKKVTDSQSPMYFFLTQLYMNKCCIIQLYFFACSEGSECFLLSIMAYDRYVAICYPLRYVTLMNHVLCIKLVIVSWLSSFSIVLIEIISVTKLQFCGSYIIDHFFCDFIPLKELACSDTHFFETEVFLLCIPAAVSPLIIIILSYIYIVQAVLRISTNTERGKAFSTCSSHLTVVSIFYGTLIGSYMIPSKGKSLAVSRVVSLLYTVVTPMINPIIYSFRNEDIKDAVISWLKKGWKGFKDVLETITSERYKFTLDSCILLTTTSFGNRQQTRNFVRTPPACMAFVIGHPLYCGIVLIDTLSVYQIPFCGSNIIDHFFCDLAPLLELACSDTSSLQLEILILCIPVAVSPLVIILLSYAYIVKAVLRISTKTGQWKAFSTCSSHITVVSIFYGSLIGSYMMPAKGKSLTFGKLISLLYTVMTPMINPIIYSLRTKDIKEDIKIVLAKVVSFNVRQQDLGKPQEHMTESVKGMQIINQTTVSEFLLLGFQNLYGFQRFVFFLVFVSFLGTICGNLLIIWLVASVYNLQSPMYFFLTQLSFSDLILTTTIVPNTLYILWDEGGTMSFSGCIIQLYFFACSEGSECFLLSIMAYDRYVAICNPLRYVTLMNHVFCIKLVIVSWLSSFSMVLIETISVTQLQFCGSYIIDHFFCDFIPLRELACSDTHFFEIEVFFLGIPVAVFPLIIIILSYIYIVQAVLRISTNTERGKAFSTCSSHLTVVSIFYGTLIGSYMIPSKGKSLAVSKVVSLLYTVVTPMINPIIYSFRNEDIKDARSSLLEPGVKKQSRWTSEFVRGEVSSKPVIYVNFSTYTNGPKEAQQAMQIINQTTVSEFLLLGFQNLYGFQRLFFFLVFVSFLGTICGNLLIIWLVASVYNLQSPMYFFLTQLSFSDLILTTTIVPNTLYILWNEGGTMSFSGCIIQLYFFACSEGSECFLLSIMAYDRYVAICYPLRYVTLMNHVLCIKLAIVSWLSSFCMVLNETISVTQLQFCGSNIIDHFFCDFIPLRELACSDIYSLDIEVFLLGIPAAVFPLIIIILSYIYIVQAVLRISTNTERGKAFSTCSSHLTVVSIFYGTLIGSYMIPSKGKSLAVSKVVSLLYTVVTPMINPIIYSFRNEDIKDAVISYEGLSKCMRCIRLIWFHFEILILGFPILHAFRIPFFHIILLIYSITLSENILIIILVSTSHQLQSPLYFFLAHLATTDIILVTNVVPNMLYMILREGVTILFWRCMTQFFVHGMSICSECFLLTVMSYDRYLAICTPLHYILIMNKLVRYSSVACCWTLSVIFSLLILVLTCQLDFCGPNVIDHFFCDFAPVLQLSCSETSILTIYMFVLSIPAILITFIFIAGTYICISVAIIKIPSLSGRQKAFSTCSSHLVVVSISHITVVSIFYGSLIGSYMMPAKGKSLTFGKLISLLYTVMTPMINPIIYSLRTKDIKEVLPKLDKSASASHSSVEDLNEAAWQGKT